MPFPTAERVRFRVNTLGHVEASLDFDEILSISLEQPDTFLATFQAELRADYPDYDVQLTEDDDGGRRSALRHHNFRTSDGKRFVHLATTHLSLVEGRYTTWEHFRGQFLAVAELFRRVYKPSTPFSGVSIVYLNYLRKSLLDSGTEWSDLVKRELMGLSNCSFLAEGMTSAYVGCAEVMLQGAPPNTLQQVRATLLQPRVINEIAGNEETEPEPTFVLESFTNCIGGLKYDQLKDVCDAFHQASWNFFAWAIEPRLRQALGPGEVVPEG
jgi:uncharacterized protein (TIGR04255 family)